MESVLQHSTMCLTTTERSRPIRKKADEIKIYLHTHDVPKISG
jgi:hypothetical protein